MTTTTLTTRTQATRSTNVGGRRRRALTLVEILVAVGIVSLLLSIVIVGSRSIIASRARSTAQQQLAAIASAIDRYASFWPRWEIGGVVVADKGWPDPFPVRVFNPSRYQMVAPFNSHVQFRVAGAGSGIIEDLLNFTLPDRVVANDGAGGDVLGANVCLTYALLAKTGQGPYLEQDDASVLIRRVSEIDGNAGQAVLPAPLIGFANVPAEALVDPWGMPYRYFWVYRDSNAYHGYLPVTTADVTSGAFRKAVGFVLESAGPDRKFGNLWQLGTPSLRDRDEAADNLIITP